MTATPRLVFRLRSIPLIGWLAVAASIAVVTALLTPGSRWASSGSLRLPVRVVVFDAAEGLPIKGAVVRLFRASQAEGQKEIPEPITADSVGSVDRQGRAITGGDGTAVIEYEFRTGASNQSPTPKAHLRWEWVMVSADGFGTAVVPVRHESVPTKTLRDRKQLLVLIGLMKADRDR